MLMVGAGLHIPTPVQYADSNLVRNISSAKEKRRRNENSAQRERL
jgi:hypothetical protein